MTTNVQTKKQTYPGDGATSSFAFSFPILDESHLLVELRHNTTEAITTQVLTTNYTVSGTGNTVDLTDYTSGTINFTSIPSSSYTVIIRRQVPLTQTVDYLENDNFPAETHEDALDKLTMLDLQQQEQLDRTLKFDSGVSSTIGEIGTPTADYYLKRNSNNNGWEWVQLSTSSGLGNVADDTTPQLGGDLDLNSQNITGTGDINITGGYTVTTASTVDGSADEVQLKVQGHSTQTSNILEIENSAGTDLLTVDGSGVLTLGTTTNMNVPLGTTGERPGSPTEGMVRGNTTTNNIEYYDGTSWVDLTAGAQGGIGEVLDDTSPQLGGQLDVNGQAIGDGTRELITFTEDASAVNQINIENEATGSGPIISAAGDDTNIDLNLDAKGTGAIKVSGQYLQVDYGATGPGEVRLAEDSDNGSNYIGLKSPSSVTTSVSFQLPSADGSANQVLTTDGSASLSFATVRPTWVPLASVTASSSATAEFTSNIDSTYDTYAIVYRQIVPVTDGARLYLRVSKDGGSTYLSSGYYGQTFIVGSSYQLGLTSAFIPITSATTALGVDNNAANGGVSGILYFSAPSSSSVKKMFWGSGGYAEQSDSNVYSYIFSGKYNTDSDAIDAVQLYFSSGNIASGEFILYGIRES